MFPSPICSTVQFQRGCWRERTQAGGNEGWQQGESSNPRQRFRKAGAVGMHDWESWDRKTVPGDPGRGEALRSRRRVWPGGVVRAEQRLREHPWGYWGHWKEGKTEISQGRKSLVNQAESLIHIPQEPGRGGAEVWPEAGLSDDPGSFQQPPVNEASSAAWTRDAPSLMIHLPRRNSAELQEVPLSRPQGPGLPPLSSWLHMRGQKSAERLGVWS